MEVALIMVDGVSNAIEITKEESMIIDFFKTKREVGVLSSVLGESKRRTWERIATLRLKGIPLVGDQYGVWLSTSSKEIDNYTRYQAKRAKNTIKSEFAIIKSLRDTARIEQIKMFDEPRGNWFTRLFSYYGCKN